MTLLDFEIIRNKDHPNIEISHSNQIFDLHNAAELILINYDVVNNKYILHWKYYYRTGHVSLIQLSFQGLKSINLSVVDSEIPKAENSCLKEIKYDKFFELIFMGEMKICIQAEEARMTISDLVSIPE